MTPVGERPIESPYVGVGAPAFDYAPTRWKPATSPTVRSVRSCTTGPINGVTCRRPTPVPFGSDRGRTFDYVGRVHVLEPKARTAVERSAMSVVYMRSSLRLED